MGKGKIKINDKNIETYERVIPGKDTTLHVIAGSTGYKGCNKREAGGRTYIRIKCLRGDFYFEPIEDDDARVTGIEIACCGDEGLDAIMKALEFAVEVIDDERCGINK